VVATGSAETQRQRTRQMRRSRPPLVSPLPFARRDDARSELVAANAGGPRHSRRKRSARAWSQLPSRPREGAERKVNHPFAFAVLSMTHYSISVVTRVLAAGCAPPRVRHAGSRNPRLELLKESDPLMLFSIKRMTLAVVSMAMTTACGTAPDAQENVSEARSGLTSGLYDGLNSAPTQCTVGGITMHCCPPNMVMIGARIDKNVFRCEQAPEPTGVPLGAPFLDDNTQINNMHSCPKGTVMVGLHAALNKLACAAAGPPEILRVLENFGPGLQDAFPMHVCSLNGASRGMMSGIRIDQNNFNCTDVLGS
jgi:hypothetical protein